MNLNLSLLLHHTPKLNPLDDVMEIIFFFNCEIIKRYKRYFVDEINSFEEKEDINSESIYLLVEIVDNQLYFNEH